MDLLSRSPEGMGESLLLLQYIAARLEMGAGRPQESLAWLNRMREGGLLRDEGQMRVLDLEASIHAQLGQHEEAYLKAWALLEATLKRSHQERSILVRRLELSEVAERAQRQVEQAQQVMSDLQAQLTEVQSVGKHYRTLSVTDALTGLGNRRQFDEDLQLLKEGDGLLMIDIDHFKRVTMPWVTCWETGSSAMWPRESRQICRKGAALTVTVVRSLPCFYGVTAGVTCSVSVSGCVRQ